MSNPSICNSSYISFFSPFFKSLSITKIKFRHLRARQTYPLLDSSHSSHGLSRLRWVGTKQACPISQKNDNPSLSIFYGKIIICKNNSWAFLPSYWPDEKPICMVVVLFDLQQGSSCHSVHLGFLPRITNALFSKTIKKSYATFNKTIFIYFWFNASILSFNYISFLSMTLTRIPSSPLSSTIGEMVKWLWVQTRLAHCSLVCHF